MASVFEGLTLLGPAAIVAEALGMTATGIALLLGFILLRRALRSRYFRRLNRRTREIRENWNLIVSGDIPSESWFFDRLDQPIVEGILLDRLEVAVPEEAHLLQERLRNSGLLDKRIREVRRCRGWRRRQAILALGRMRIAEGIPALADALHDADEETAVDAVRGLGRVGSPEAAKPILDRLTQGPSKCPPQILQSALLNCFQHNASLLLADLKRHHESLRPVLARVLAEAADENLQGDLLELASDLSAEVRASSARALAVAHPPYALTALSRLATDEEWFVRLRAIVALGELKNRRAIPLLIEGLRDSNRYVRLRAAAALASFEGEEEKIFYLTRQTDDRYALQALVSEMQRSGRISELVNALADPQRQELAEAALLEALHCGSQRLLIDLLLHHRNWRTRGFLARLVAQSGDQRFLEQLEQVELNLLSRRQQRVLRWLIDRLRDSEGSRRSHLEVLAS
ncbi:MAG TPA: HEAT repeat domain-containing protein [Terriglobia bacterium]|nr:HEAT repeat domain-containing protein [Terriglobia bacterium]